MLLLLGRRRRAASCLLKQCSTTWPTTQKCFESNCEKFKMRNGIAIARIIIECIQECFEGCMHRACASPLLERSRCTQRAVYCINAARKSRSFWVVCNSSRRRLSASSAAAASLRLRISSSSCTSASVSGDAAGGSDPSSSAR